MTAGLARRHRPQLLSDLIGQTNLVQILSHALDNGNIAQAFLLTGIRGCGKTSTARIIAASINCDKGPTSKPCLTCFACQSIRAGKSPDVVEIDAASNTGVDDIRAVIDSVGYAPFELRRKVVIVDEVHMLSKSAFNALLKTLEEPPEHAVFILATTEFRKVPSTIVSRCQRFDLKRIPFAILKAHLTDVSRQEGATLEEGAIDLITRAADGSVRDGLSILEQAMSGAMTSEASVRGMLGLAARGVSARITTLALEGKQDAALALTREALATGADPYQILKDMLDISHAATVLKASPKADLTSAYSPREIELASNVQAGFAETGQAWKLILAGLEDAQTAPFPQQSLDMTIIRIAMRARSARSTTHP